MSYTKTKGVPVTPKPLTEEEKKEQVARFLGQKRESFATGILFNLCSGLDFVPDKDDAKDLIERSVNMADELIKELYSPKED